MKAFWWWWGAAAAFHVIGNRRWGEVWPDPTVLGWLTLALLAAAIWAMARPGPRPGTVVAVLVPLVALAETPVLSNHMLLASFVSVGILLARPWSGGFEDRFVPGGRSIVVVFYSFAAFAKLNEAFFDPSVSCAVFYADQGMAAIGLPGASGTAIAPVVPWVAAGIELSVPFLLSIGRTRKVGVVVATAFHVLLSLDLGQHFYDFTAVLVPLFLLFWPDRAALEERAGAAVRGPLRLVAPVWLGLVGVLGVLTLLPVTEASWVVVQYVSFGLWVPMVIGWVVVLVGSSRGPWFRLERNGSPRSVESPVPRPGVAMWVLVGVVVVNGLLPWLEVKRVADFTMYANLAIADGETNHLVVRRSLPLGDGNADPFTIVASDDPVYEPYVDSGWLLPERNLAEAPPGASTLLERAGAVAEPPPPLEWPAVWFNRLLPLRSIDATSPTRCQTVFLPAR